MSLSMLGVLAAETTVVRDGDAGEFAIPDRISISAAFVGEKLLTGRVTQVSSQHQGFQLHIGLGTAFTFDFDGERLRVKPSIEYSRTETKVSGVAHRGIRIVDVDPFVDGMKVRSLDHFRLLRLADDHTEVYHGLGPALEVEYDTRNRIGPFLLSVYLKGAGSYLFGDLETELDVANPEYPEERVHWEYKNDRWAYRAATGVRFRYVPKSMKK